MPTSEVRAALGTIARRFDAGDPEPVFFGSHRRGATVMARSWILERLATEETSADDPRAVLQRLRSDVEHLASALGGR